MDAVTGNEKATKAKLHLEQQIEYNDNKVRDYLYTSLTLLSLYSVIK